MIKKILFFICLIKISSCLQTELSILIEAGKRECLHQFLIPNLQLETDYQVISGGDLDISYWISTPSNRILFTEVRKQGGQFQFKTDETGEYRFCFDNSFSRFSNKQVFFYLSTNDQYVDPHFPASSEQQLPNVPAKDNLGELDERIENFKQMFNKVNVNLERAQHVQRIFQAYELADRNAMEESFERVNFWSILNIIVMISVGVVQVVMIRSLFEDKSKIGKVLRGDKSEKKSFT